MRLFMTDALNAGITTVINYAHNTQSPAHVDAEIRAMMESGLRGRYAYSGPDPYPDDKTMDFDDILRVKRTVLLAAGQPDRSRLWAAALDAAVRAAARPIRRNSASRSTTACRSSCIQARGPV